MTTLTDPVHIEVPPRTPAEPGAPLDPPREDDRNTPRRRSRRFTVRSNAAVLSYSSWERAIGAARSLAAGSGTATSLTDDYSGSRFDVATDGHASPSRV